MAGAPGFEPGIAGPKPAALPLGYAPPRSSIGSETTAHRAALQTAAPAKPARPPSGIASDAAALGYAPPYPSIETRPHRSPRCAPDGRAGEAGAASKRHRKRRRRTWLRPIGAV